METWGRDVVEEASIRAQAAHLQSPRRDQASGAGRQRSRAGRAVHGAAGHRLGRLRPRPEPPEQLLGLSLPLRAADRCRLAAMAAGRLLRRCQPAAPSSRSAAARCSSRSAKPPPPRRAGRRASRASTPSGSRRSTSTSSPTERGWQQEMNEGLRPPFSWPLAACLWGSLALAAASLGEAWHCSSCSSAASLRQRSRRASDNSPGARAA